MPQSPEMFTDGALYERLMGRWSRLAGDQFLRWLEAPANQRWLDVGCGNGAFTEEIVAKAKPSGVVGIDPSDAQIAFARARPALHAAAFHVGDAQALPFQDNEFDVGVMALVISFVPDPARGAAELARVVKPGGTVATYMWDLPNFGVPLSPLYRALVKLGHPAPQPPNPHASASDAMRTLWQEAGLASVETTVLRITVSYPDFDDFWQSSSLPVGPLSNVIGNLSPAAINALQTELRAQRPANPDGSISYEAFANAVKGRKV
jgi:SAM-dependent methyltransferase